MSESAYQRAESLLSGVAEAIGVCTAIVVVSAASLWGLASPFTWHPLLMAIAFLFFMTEGVFAYRAPGDRGTRPDRRKTHAILQIGSFLCCVGGLAAILYNKVAHGKSVLPRSWHALIATGALVLMLVQAAAGARKYLVLTKEGARVHTWHGKAGIAVYLLGLLALFTGVYKTLEGAAWGLALFGTAALGALAVSVLYAIPVLKERALYSDSAAAPGAGLDVPYRTFS
eukprot:tig00020537_g10306.t1